MNKPTLVFHPMQTNDIGPFCRGLVLALGICLAAATPLTAQDNCKAVHEAMMKVFSTPTHLYDTTDINLNKGAKPRTIETIYVGGSVYTNYPKGWSGGDITIEQVMKMEQSNIQNSKDTCRYLRDEPVNGEMAAVFSTHAERADMNVKSDGQIWISKRTGLPLRDDIDIDGGSLGGKQHHSTRYEYTNVKAPQ